MALSIREDTIERRLPMAKAKSKAQIMVADGSGALVPVQDRRFEQGDWPISFEIPKDKADSWLSYLYAESTNRGWSSGGMGQIEAKENSGSLFVNSGASELGQLAIVWERKRNGPLKVRAKPTGATDPSMIAYDAFLTEVNRRC